MASTKKNQSNLINLVFIVLIFLVKLIPAPWGLTDAAFQVLATLILGMPLLIVGTWGVWGILLSLFLTPGLTIAQVMGASLGSSTVLYCILCFMFSGVLMELGLAKRIAISMITSKLGRKGSWWTVAMILFSSFIVGSFLSQIATFLMFLPILYHIFQETGCEKTGEDILPTLLIVGVSVFTAISQAATPIAHTITIYGMNAYMKSMGQPLDFATYVFNSLPITLVILVLAFLVFRFLWKPDVSRLDNLNYDSVAAQISPMTKSEIIGAVVYVIVVILWILPGVVRLISADAYNNVYSKINECYPPIIGLIILGLIKVDGQPIIDYKKIIDKIPMPTILFMTVVLALSSCLTNADVGLSAWLSQMLGGLLGNMSPALFLVILASISIILTNFAPNMIVVAVAMAVAMPLVTTVYADRLDPVVVGTVLTAAASYSFATPAACPTSAIACGTGWINTKLNLKWGMIIAVLACVVYALQIVIFG